MKIITGTGTILVIEDEEMVMDVLRAIIERLGYRILETKTGKEAIGIAKTFQTAGTVQAVGTVIIFL